MTELALCDAEKCRARGAGRLAAFCRARFGAGFDEAAPGGGFAVRRVYCIGLCKGAPCGAFGGRSLSRLTEAKLEAIIATALAAAPGRT